MKDYAKYIDHTLLAMNATADQIKQLCSEAVKYNFYSVCVNSCYVPLASKLLKDTNVKVCSVIGFPLGSMLSSCKVFETKEAITAGAKEIDMVINIGMLKNGEMNYVKNEIKAVFEASGTIPLKVIIETCLLTNEQII